MSRNEKTGIDELIVRQVAALVAATAEVMAGDDMKKVLELEAFMYRALATNCADKAKMAEGFMKGTKVKQPPKQLTTKEYMRLMRLTRKWTNEERAAIKAHSLS